MANLKVNNYHNLKLMINKDEYWDFFVNKDSYGSFRIKNGLYDDCLISYIDLSDDECFDSDNWVYSKQGYYWNKSISLGYTLHNISYTGVDNGLFTFRKDRISNKDFLRIFQDNKFEIYENDYRLKLHAVSGNTLQYDYPLHIENGSAKLNGGFFQGFFKTECDKYQILPTSFEHGDTINFEFTLKRCNLEKESDKTLNDKYPENKGIFFYLGTRAENKWIYQYDKDDVDGLEACYELGVDNFVQDGEINEDDYIIGNFYDPNPDFEGYEPFELGEYTNYRDYDVSPFELDDMSDFFSEESKELPYHTFKKCHCEEPRKDENEVDILLPFFHGCPCQISYKEKEKDPSVCEPVDGCDEFGDDYIFDNGEVVGVDEVVDYLEPELDITDFEYETDNGFKLSEANQYYFYTDNKFLFFDRTKTGKTVSNWVEGTEFMYAGRKSQFKGNLFILMNRTKTGYTVADIDSLRDQSANDYNPYNELYNNALAFRITDKGEIGYRMLVRDCNNKGRDKTSIIEGYSFEDIIPDCEWCTVNVRMSFIFGKMKLFFYVNGNLKYVTKDLPMIELKALNELYEKQEGVPYNISLGGGTQGLAETIQQNYMLNPSRVYPLERYFAGTFIGYISSFKIYDCVMEKLILEHNYRYEKGKHEIN